MHTQKWTWKIPLDVPIELTSERADRAILKALEAGLGEGEHPVCSRSQLQRLIEEGRVTVDRSPLKPTARLRPGLMIEIEFPPPKSLSLIPEARPIDILFEDAHLLVLNKPQGLTVHPSATQTEGTLVHALLHHVKDLSGIGGALRPGIVHRIDKNTSGAMVITKTDATHRVLVETFSKHAIERRYWALCYGSPKEKSGKIESLIGRSPTDRKKMSMKVKHGRKAITHYQCLERYAFSRSHPFASLIEATLETGRTHQVRVHLTGLGHSLLGDPEYGTPSEKQAKWIALPQDVQSAVKKLSGQALHARILGFSHPITGEKLRFEAEPPEAFRQLLETLRRYA